MCANEACGAQLQHYWNFKKCRFESKEADQMRVVKTFIRALQPSAPDVPVGGQHVL